MRVVSVSLLVPLLAASVVAGPVTQPIKWSQLPDMVGGLDYSSEVKVPSVVASDWLCPDGLPVTDIHWWGSYWVPNLPVPPDGSSFSDGLPNAPAGGIQWFTLKIWSDIPEGPAPFSRPGQLLWTYETSNYNEVLFGVTQAGEEVYQYNVYLPQTQWFPQVQGQIYWLSIEANLPDPWKQWGWHESKDHSFDDAVQDFKGSGWVELMNNTYSVDMAFELTTPEPTSLLLLGVAWGILCTRKR